MTGQKYTMLAPGGGEQLRFLDDSLLVLKDDGERSGTGITTYEYIAAPSAKGSPQHIHRGHDETFYVVEGRFEFTLGTRAFVAEPGSFLLVQRGQPHGFRNMGASKGRIVGTFGSRFAQYFRELAQIIERTGTVPSRGDWDALYGRYETTFYEPS
ncbi:MAG: cupin domain-containing protein [Planctomycetota bacterium]